jgi:hypothetical protein
MSGSAGEEHDRGWLLAEDDGGSYPALMAGLLADLDPEASDEFTRRCLARMAGRPEDRKLHRFLVPFIEIQSEGHVAAQLPFDAEAACEVLSALPSILAGVEASTACEPINLGDQMQATRAAQREARRVEVRWCYGEIAKLSGLTERESEVLVSFVDEWDGGWLELLGTATRMAAEASGGDR